MFNRGRPDANAKPDEFAHLNRRQLIRELEIYREGLHKLAQEMLYMVNWRNVWWSKN